MIHPQPKEPIVAHATINKHSVEIKPASVISHDYVTQNDRLNIATVAGGGTHAVTIIVVVCVGFLMFMIVLGVVRIRAAQNRSTNEEAQDSEMTWDDSALTITVNPMEVHIKKNVYTYNVIGYHSATLYMILFRRTLNVNWKAANAKPPELITSRRASNPIRLIRPTTMKRGVLGEAGLAAYPIHLKMKKLKKKWPLEGVANMLIRM